MYKHGFEEGCIFGGKIACRRHLQNSLGPYGGRVKGLLCTIFSSTSRLKYNRIFLVGKAKSRQSSFGLGAGKRERCHFASHRHALRCLFLASIDQATTEHFCPLGLKFCFNLGQRGRRFDASVSNARGPSLNSRTPIFDSGRSCAWRIRRRIAAQSQVIPCIVRYSVSQ